MPRGDGTGPQGKGPMTGRGMGRCSTNQTTVNNTKNQVGFFSSLRKKFSGTDGGSGSRRGYRGSGRGSRQQ